jgi:DNA-binding NarL/FixJ family response regulator
VHIIILDKSIEGRKMLNRILTADGYEVSHAESGSRAIDLLKETRTNIVLMNVSQCLCSSNGDPERSLTIRQLEASNSTLLVTCGVNDEELYEFISPENLCHSPALELPPTKIKSSSINRILQLCSALRQSRYLSHPDEDFNWRRFSLLMNLPTDAYLGCRFSR